MAKRKRKKMDDPVMFSPDDSALPEGAGASESARESEPILTDLAEPAEASHIPETAGPENGTFMREALPAIEPADTSPAEKAPAAARAAVEDEREPDDRADFTSDVLDHKSAPGPTTADDAQSAPDAPMASRPETTASVPDEPASPLIPDDQTLHAMTPNEMVRMLRKARSELASSARQARSLAEKTNFLGGRLFTLEQENEKLRIFHLAQYEKKIARKQAEFEDLLAQKDSEIEVLTGRILEVQKARTQLENEMVSRDAHLSRLKRQEKEQLEELENIRRQAAELKDHVKIAETKLRDRDREILEFENFKRIGAENLEWLERALGERDRSILAIEERLKAAARETEEMKALVQEKGRRSSHVDDEVASLKLRIEELLVRIDERNTRIQNLEGEITERLAQAQEGQAGRAQAEQALAAWQTAKAELEETVRRQEAELQKVIKDKDSVERDRARLQAREEETESELHRVRIHMNETAEQLDAARAAVSEWEARYRLLQEGSDGTVRAPGAGSGRAPGIEPLPSVAVNPPTGAATWPAGPGLPGTSPQQPSRQPAPWWGTSLAYPAGTAVEVESRPPQRLLLPGPRIFTMPEPKPTIRPRVSLLVAAGCIVIVAGLAGIVGLLRQPTGLLRQPQSPGDAAFSAPASAQAAESPVAAAAAPAAARAPKPLPDYRHFWDTFGRSAEADGLSFHVLLKSPAEVEAAIQQQGAREGLSSGDLGERRTNELSRFDFERYQYASVYVKTTSPDKWIDPDRLYRGIFLVDSTGRKLRAVAPAAGFRAREVDTVGSSGRRKVTALNFMVAFERSPGFSFGEPLTVDIVEPKVALLFPPLGGAF